MNHVKVLQMTASDTAARVGDLLAGSEYTVTVAAVNTRGEVCRYLHYIYTISTYLHCISKYLQAGPGVSADTWTSVGVPDTPSPPTVLSWDRARGRLRVRVQQVENNGGEVRYYQVRCCR